MKKQPYAQQLRDPRWQKKRLEIMERDGFTCRHCESTKKTLNVHHTYYESGAAPWEYPEHALVTFCEDCHKNEEAYKTNWDCRLMQTFRRAGATNADVERIVLMMEDMKDEYGGGLLAFVTFLLEENVEPANRPVVVGAIKPREFIISAP
ncbi:MAG: hypothetical protein U1E51_26330 [Candidatus Binatia bacterium]|nr:hypothetical protein [Candidatus Binatia bacterium]